MNYYYSQRYPVYEWWGMTNPTMGQKGCLVTATAMLLSYFNDSAMYPDDWLRWLRQNNGLTGNGNFLWHSLVEATDSKLRYSTKPNAKNGETTYGLRECWLSGQKHWVLDHPLEENKIIDPWDGQVKAYDAMKYTGRVVYYIGKK